MPSWPTKPHPQAATQPNSHHQAAPWPTWDPVNTHYPDQTLNRAAKRLWHRVYRLGNSKR